MPGLNELIVISFGSLTLGTIVGTIAFWRICGRAGYPPCLGLLMLVPVANIVLPLYIAFAKWPSRGRPGGAQGEGV